MPQWLFAAGPRTAAAAQLELRRATGRTVRWELRGSASASFTLRGEASEAASVVELASDVWVLLDGEAVFRGRVGSADDRIAPGAHTSTWQVADYRSMLGRCEVRPGDRLAWVDVDQGQIAWQAVAQHQAKPGGALGVVDGLGSVLGVVRSKTVEAGVSVAKLIDDLALADGGFEWEVDASLALNRWLNRGGDLTAVYDYGGRVARAGRRLDPWSRSNDVLVTGDPAAGAAVAVAADVASVAWGRLCSTVAAGDLKEPAAVSARAAYELARGRVASESWEVTLRRDAWQSPADGWLGDRVTLYIAAGRVNVAAAHRITGVSVAIPDGDGDAAVVSMTLEPV